MHPLADLKTMLGNNKALKDIFSYSAQATGVQPVALAQSIYAYAANINDLSPLLPTVIRIAEKHAALGVKAEHYPIVAANLMPAITHVLGDAFTPELQSAWYHVSKSRSTLS
jgi:nitric oxide dioxygenase